MTPRNSREANEARARGRFIIINAARFAGVAMVMAGFAIIRGLIDLPYWLGVGVALLGLAEFFVTPLMLTRAWKARDDKRP